MKRISKATYGEYRQTLNQLGLLQLRVALSQGRPLPVNEQQLMTDLTNKLRRMESEYPGINI